MPSNGDTSANADKLSGIEEESDIYEAFPPHVDTAQITVLSDSPTGKRTFFLVTLLYVKLLSLFSNSVGERPFKFRTLRSKRMYKSVEWSLLLAFDLFFRLIFDWLRYSYEKYIYISRLNIVFQENSSISMMRNVFIYNFRVSCTHLVVLTKENLSLKSIGLTFLDVNPLLGTFNPMN